MTREQREQFVRHQIFQGQIFEMGTWESVVQNIVNRWEADLIETYETGCINTRDVMWY